MRSIEQAFEPRVTRPCHTTGGRTTGARTAGARTAGRRAPARAAHLTRRGRAVVVLLMLLLLVLAGFTLGRVSSQAAGPSRPLPTVTVEPGETLWQIAARVAPHADRRALVRQIEQLNDLGDGRVLVGQQLRLPR